MADQDLRLSPLGSVNEGFPEGLREIGFQTQINLRGNIEDTAFSAAIKSAIGVDLSSVPNKVSQENDIKALWLSPDEWLIVAGDGQQSALVQKLEKALTGQHVAVNDLSANRTVFELTGPDAHTALMKSCEIDLHPRVFLPGDCVQTLIAKSQVLIEQTDLEAFHLYVRCSFSQYIGAWLADTLNS